ncbi:MAG: glycosyltransferase family 2 protein [Armatimonadia bacterium]
MDARHEPQAQADIVIPVYNQLEYTRACLDSLRSATDWPHQLIIIDNGSSDGTSEYLSSLQSAGWPLQVIANSRNLGFTLAANQGMRAARSHYVVLLNNDTTVTQHWLFGLLRVAESSDDIGIVGPKILSPQTDCIRGIGGLVFREGRVQGPLGEGCSREDPTYGVPCEVQYAEGSCMLIKRPVIETIGYLDEQYAPAYYEDTDYCFRAREAGFRIVYSPYSAIYHHSTVTAQTVQREDSQFTRAALRNERTFRERWSHRFG